METNRINRLFVVSALIITGISGIIAEIILLRELLITFFGNELTIGVILSSWLFCEAIGAAGIGRLIEKTNRQVETFVLFLILFALSFPVSVFFARTARSIFSATYGQGMGIPQITAAALLAISLTSILHGALFTFGCKVFGKINSSNGEISTGKVYFFETLGTALGGALLSFVLTTRYSSVEIAFAVSFVNILIALIILSLNFMKKIDRPVKAIAVFSIAALTFFTYSIITGKTAALQNYSLKKQWGGQNILAYKNSHFGNITIIKSGEQYTFHYDGLPIITVPTPDIIQTEELAHIPLLFHENPKNIFLIGGGAGGIINEILKHPVKNIDYAELDPALINAVKKHKTRTTEEELQNPKVNVVLKDGSIVLKSSTSLYDLIIIGFSEPANLQINRFYSKEFFALAKKRMRKGGILSVSLPGSLTYLNDELSLLNSTLLNTLNEVFKTVRIVPGDSYNIYLAQTNGADEIADTQTVIKRLRERHIKTNFLSPPYIESKLHKRRKEFLHASLKKYVNTKSINSNFTPLSVYHQLSYWNSLFAPKFQGFFKYFGNISALMFLLSISFFIAVYLAIRNKYPKLPQPGVFSAITFTGFAGMGLELLIIFAFQIIYGYVFYWIGILLTSLMLGTGIGSMYIIGLKRDRLKSYKMLIITEVLFIIVIAATWISISAFSGPSIASGLHVILKISFFMLSLFTGALVGAQFPLATILLAKPKNNLTYTAGNLYAADLLGGWMGGLLCSILLLPVLGLLKTCIIITALKALSLLLLLFYRRELILKT